MKRLYIILCSFFYALTIWTSEQLSDIYNPKTIYKKYPDIPQECWNHIYTYHAKASFYDAIQDQMHLHHSRSVISLLKMANSFPLRTLRTWARKKIDRLIDNWKGPIEHRAWILQIRPDCIKDMSFNQKLFLIIFDIHFYNIRHNQDTGWEPLTKLIDRNTIPFFIERDYLKEVLDVMRVHWSIYHKKVAHIIREL